MTTLLHIHSRDQLRAIIERCGYHATFEEHVNKAGNGVSTTYVYAYFYRLSGSGKTARSLGKIEDVAKLSEATITARIAARFGERAKSQSSEV